MVSFRCTQIRADCDTVGYSDWSIDDLSPQERHTTLFPNPAQTHCTLFSSFHISHVELFTLQGQRLLQQPVQGLSTEIDIAAGKVVKILTKR